MEPRRLAQGITDPKSNPRHHPVLPSATPRRYSHGSVSGLTGKENVPAPSHTQWRTVAFAGTRSWVAARGSTVGIHVRRARAQPAYRCGGSAGFAPASQNQRNAGKVVARNRMAAGTLIPNRNRVKPTGRMKRYRLITPCRFSLKRSTRTRKRAEM